MPLSKKQANDAVRSIVRKTKEIDASEIEAGQTVIVQEPTAFHKDSFIGAMYPEVDVGAGAKQSRVISTQVSTAQKYALLPHSLVDEDGAELWNAAQVKKLPPPFIERAWETWMELAGLSGDEEGKD